MKKLKITVAIVAIIACAMTIIYCTAERKAVTDEAVISPASGQVVADGADKKTLVVYFSMPETDGVDASSGASRVVADGEVMGNTQYVASVISEATAGDLFEIRTVHTYPGSH